MGEAAAFVPVFCLNPATICSFSYEIHVGFTFP